MTDFSFLAIPNIEGMRLSWYIQIFAVLVVFGVCLFFVMYFILHRRRSQQFAHQLDDLRDTSARLSQQMLIKKLVASSGKNKVVLFIEYLERFVTIPSYANL